MVLYNVLMEKSNLSPEMERLMAENAVLKEENQVLSDLNQVLSDMVDNYDKALTEMTALQRVSTKNLNEANEIIKRFTTGG